MDPAEAKFRELVAAASGLQDERRWEEAGRTWIEAARTAVDARAVLAARQCLLAASEAFRRDDRLGPAERALETLLSLGPDAVQRAAARIQLAGIRSAKGDRDGASALQVEDLGADVPPAVRAIGIDVAIAIAWQWGSRDELRSLVERLAEVEGADGVAVAFRRAQLRRADGDLEGAEQAYRALVARLSVDDAPGAAVGAASAQAELAEVMVLAGRPDEGLALYEAAVASQAQAGRGSLSWLAEAGRVRAAREAGLDVLTTRLEQGLAYALDRQLVTVAVVLDAALGEAMGARDPAAAALRLERAVADADRVGLRHAAGRARLALAALSGEPRRRALLDRAVVDLADDVPWRLRAERERDRP